MKLVENLRREAWLLSRDAKLLTSLLVVMLLASVSVASGLAQVRDQHRAIAQLHESDRQVRQALQQSKTSWGDLAYYSFHFTYDPPGPLAFAAQGLRDELPWKHRIRMLALEGQIYEQDLTNPELALVGRFDFAFLTAYLLPLILILLLHDGQTKERSAGRFMLLSATAAPGARLWSTRSGLVAALLMIALVVPLGIGALIAQTPLSLWAQALGAVVLYLGFWTALCHWVASWRRPQGFLLSLLLGIWVLWAAIIPSAGRVLIDRAVSLPSGADITLTQREAVNDAWDLPKAETMDAFAKSHPEWQAHLSVQRPFEWKWYFAFQQVGDEKTAALTTAYRNGRMARDQLAARLAWLAPPVLLERTLTHLAATNLSRALSHEAAVRSFHGQLRSFYYPKLFTEQAFDKAELAKLPTFAPLAADAK